MRIRLLRNVQIPDHPGIKAGDVFDIATERGEILVRIGDAEAVEIGSVQTRDPVVESRDPIIEKPARKRQSKST